MAAVLWRGILAFAAAVEVCHPFFDHTGGDSLYRNTIPPTTKGPGSTENFGGGLFLISAIPKLENHVEIILRFRAVEGKITIIQPIYRWYMFVFSFVYIYIYIGYSSKGTQLSPSTAGPFGECILYSFQYNGTVGMPLTDG